MWYFSRWKFCILWVDAGNWQNKCFDRSFLLYHNSKDLGHNYTYYAAKLMNFKVFSRLDLCYNQTMQINKEYRNDSYKDLLFANSHRNG